jgi:5-methylthioadenosine/S-adenosylhomocysteine deaminase
MNEESDPAAIPGEETTTILAAQWVLPIAADPIADGAVAIKGEQITGTGTFKDISAANPGAQVRKFEHAIILPGFVNCHSHIEYSVFRGLIDNKNFGQWLLDFIDYRDLLDQQDIEASALLGASDVVASGITTLADGMYSGASLDAIRGAGLRARVYQEAFGLDDHQLDEDMANQWLDRCRRIPPRAIHCQRQPLPRHR